MRADERQDLMLAQRYYLQSIEYLIPAIQYEKDAKRKQDIRLKAKLYIQRAEEISNMTKKETKQPVYSRQSSTILQDSILPISDQSATTIATSIDVRNNLEILFTLFKDNQQILTGINQCLEADQLSSQNNTESFIKYQSGIAILLPLVKQIPKESDAARLLKLYIEKWLSRAENLKTKLSEQQNKQILKATEDVKVVEDDDDNVTYYKQCLIQ